MKTTHAVLTALAMLAACTPQEQPARVDYTTRYAPPDAAPGTCWAKQVIPAIVETVTHQVLVHPEVRDAAGNITRPAAYRTEISQQIVRDRQESWFETPCSHLMPPDFTASVQRALAARGVFAGPITGELDAATRDAIRRFQETMGLDSSTLSLDAARRLGLAAVAKAQ